MKKIAYFLFFACLLLACKPIVKKGEGVKKAELISEPIFTKIIPKGDTILLNSNQLNTEYWATSDTKVEFSTAWLEKALAYKGDTLPSSLAEYLLPIYTSPCMQEQLYFDISYHNIDDDKEEECILFFFHNCLTANEARTIILDQENNQWHIVQIIRGMARKPLESMRTTFDEKNKIIVCKDGFWGTNGNGLHHKLYKKVEGKYKEIAHIVNYEQSFWYMGGLFSGLSGYSHTQYSFANSKNIQITRSYTLNDYENVMLLKDVPTEEILYWDNAKQQFNSPTFDEQLNTTETVLKKELQKVLKNGTPQQKKALENFAEQVKH